MNKLTSIIVALFAMTFSTAFAGSHSVKIATVGPMSGQYASFGEQMKAGAEMAVADINANGGVNGAMLELVVGDDACDPKQAVAVANKLREENVTLVSKCKQMQHIKSEKPTTEYQCLSKNLKTNHE